MIHKRIPSAICFLLLSGILICGCSDKEPTAADPVKDSTVASSGKAPAQDPAPAKTGTPRDNTPQVLLPEASGSIVYENEHVSIDASHTDEGYFMVKYLGSNAKVKLRVNGPADSEYIYLLSGSGDYETFPLPCGNGTYRAEVLENAGGDMYVTAYAADLEVSIKNEFGPFLYPNQYVNFNADSMVTAKGSELAKDMYSDMEVIESVYHYVTQSIAYDQEKAANVAYGYLPVVDETLQSKKGICFDYAAIMSAMLRSQGIPTRLDIGYSGEAYHAWISSYIKDVGWIDNIIQFDGKSWTLMDPTLAANNDNASVGKYIGDGSNYTLKYSY